MKSFLPFVNVKTVEEYFALPKEKREKYGFYLKPFSLPWEFCANYPEEKGWDFFYREIKKKYPIQYFFRESIPDQWRLLIGYRLKDVKYWFHNLIQNPNKRLRAELPRCKWVDRTWLIEALNLAIIKDFANEIRINTHIDWDSNETHQEVRDWVFETEKFVDNLPSLREKVYESSNIHEASENLDKKIEETLIQLIKYRAYFWT